MHVSIIDRFHNSIQTRSHDSIQTPSSHTSTLYQTHPYPVSFQLTSFPDLPTRSVIVSTKFHLCLNLEWHGQCVTVDPVRITATAPPTEVNLNPPPRLPDFHLSSFHQLNIMCFHRQSRNLCFIQSNCWI